MSDALAIAVVTSTIRHLLHESLSGTEPGAVAGAEVTTVLPSQLLHRPNSDEWQVGLNVYLYDVTWSHEQISDELTFRGSTWPPGQHAIAALDLHYLVTAYGDDAALEPQRLLARAANALASTPVLTGPVITAAIARYGTGKLAFLANSDLAERPDPVKLMPTPLSIEDVSKLWGALATPYLLSLGYTARVVLR